MYEDEFGPKQRGRKPSIIDFAQRCKDKGFSLEKAERAMYWRGGDSWLVEEIKDALKGLYVDEDADEDDDFCGELPYWLEKYLSKHLTESYIVKNSTIKIKINSKSSFYNGRGNDDWNYDYEVDYPDAVTAKIHARINLDDLILTDEYDKLSSKYFNCNIKDTLLAAVSNRVARSFEDNEFVGDSGDDDFATAIIDKLYRDFDIQEEIAETISKYDAKSDTYIDQELEEVQDLIIIWSVGYDKINIISIRYDNNYIDVVVEANVTIRLKKDIAPTDYDYGRSRK